MTKLVSFADFSKLDLRVGTIKKVEIPTGSEYVYRLQVAFSSKGRSASGRGEDLGTRTIFAGLKKSYSEEELVGKQGVFVTNMEPKKIMGEESEGMLLAADEDNKPVMLIPIAKVKEGTKVR